jgi:hypothetical protein
MQLHEGHGNCCSGFFKQQLSLDFTSQSLQVLGFGIASFTLNREALSLVLLEEEYAHSSIYGTCALSNER